MILHRCHCLQTAFWRLRQEMSRRGHDAFGSLVPSPGLLDLFLEIPGEQRQSRVSHTNPAELNDPIPDETPDQGDARG
jgi:hypothetical protein